MYKICNKLISSTLECMLYVQNRVAFNNNCKIYNDLSLLTDSQSVNIVYNSDFVNNVPFITLQKDLNIEKNFLVNFSNKENLKPL